MMEDREREHWLSITDDPEWRRNHICDPNISLAETLAALEFPYVPQTILEIGCGFGRLTTEMARIHPQAQITGIDINPLILPAATDRITYRCQDTLDGLPPQDAIYSVALFQHLTSAQKRAYIQAAADLLTPHGSLRIQFIEGERDNFCDHWVSCETMRWWFTGVGLRIVALDRGLAHPQWTWITGMPTV